MLWAWIIAGGLVVLGLGAVVVGWRGRRVNDHPICRKCGFDLVGLSAPEKCPECGRSVTGPRAVRVGARRVRRGLLTAGALALLIGAAGGGALGWSATKGVNWNTYKPDWMLMAEADGCLGRADTSVIHELLARARGDLLRSDDLRLLADRALAVQANGNRVWDVAWGDLFVEAHRRNVVTDDARARFIRASWNVRFEVRSRVRQGIPTMVGVVQIGGYESRRGPSGGQLVTRHADSEFQFLRSGESGMEPNWTRHEWSDRGWHSGFRIGTSLTADVAPGKYRLKLDLWQHVAFAGATDQDEGWPLIWRDERDIEVTGADEPTVILRSSDATRDCLLDSLTAVLARAKAPSMRPGADGVSVHVEMAPCGLSLSMSVCVIQRGGPRDATRVCEQGICIPGLEDLIVGDALAPECTAIDLVLMPSVEAGEYSASVTEAWDGAVIFENVPTAGFNAGVTVRPTRVLSPAPKNVEDLFKKEPQPASPAEKPE